MGRIINLALISLVGVSLAFYRQETQLKEKIIAKIKLQDESTITGVLKDKSIILKNSLGTLNIPAKELISIEFHATEKDRVTFTEGILDGHVESATFTLETPYGSLKIPDKDILSLTCEYEGGEDKILLTEDWEKVDGLPNDTWLVHQSTKGNVELADKGSKDSKKSLTATGPGDGQVVQAVLTWKKLLDASKGLEIQLDFWHAASGWHYTDTVFGLCKKEDGTFCDIMHVQPSKGDGTHHVDIGVNNHKQKEREFFRKDKIYTPEEWNTIKIIIRQDRNVELYMNGKKEWTSKTKLDAEAIKKCYFQILVGTGNGPAYVDNIRIKALR